MYSVIIMTSVSHFVAHQLTALHLMLMRQIMVLVGLEIGEI